MCQTTTNGESVEAKDTSHVDPCFQEHTTKGLSSTGQIYCIWPPQVSSSYTDNSHAVEPVACPYFSLFIFSVSWRMFDYEQTLCLPKLMCLLATNQNGRWLNVSWDNESHHSKISENSKFHFCCLWQLRSTDFCSSWVAWCGLVYIHNGNYKGFGAHHSWGQICNSLQFRARFPSFRGLLRLFWAHAKLPSGGRRLSGSSNSDGADITKRTKSWFDSSCNSCMEERTQQGSNGQQRNQQFIPLCKGEAGFWTGC